MNTYATGHRNSPDSKDSIDRTDSTDLVAIAKTVRTRGLKGELVAEILTDFPERFEGLEKVIGVGPEGDRTELTIEDHWFQKDRVVLRFKRFDTIDLAEDLVGLEICVPESEAVGLEEDEFFDWQLKGCKVMAGESEIGTVTGVMRAAGNENLEVSNGTKDYLIPFVEAICTDIDIENKVIRAEIPEGLLDL
ncbi:MAG: 16S rRNA processing protein RimM [Acidobacteriota bacterium]|nr:MAG: 16S rRNA processing protein RimM [Acidobacteriota bacterium]